MNDTPTPPIPIDAAVPEPLRADYVTVATAVAYTQASDGTIRRHLRNGTLDGLKMSKVLWYVRRYTRDEDGAPPGLDRWERGISGNPNWIAKP
jgi:hypothetical protein